MSIIEEYRIDHGRVAALHGQVEKIAQELGFEVADVDIHVDASDEGHAPYLTIEFVQKRAPVPRIPDPQHPGVNRVWP